MALRCRTATQPSVPLALCAIIFLQHVARESINGKAWLIHRVDWKRCLCDMPLTGGLYTLTQRPLCVYQTGPARWVVLSNVQLGTRKRSIVVCSYFLFNSIPLVW